MFIHKKNATKYSFCNDMWYKKYLCCTVFLGDIYEIKGDKGLFYSILKG